MSDSLYEFAMKSNCYSGSWDVIVVVRPPGKPIEHLEKSFPNLHTALVETSVLLCEFADTIGDFGELNNPGPTNGGGKQPKLFE